MKRQEPQAGKLFRHTTTEEKPILLIATILIVLFWDDLSEGWLAAIVGITVILCWVVNRAEDRRKERK